MARKKEYKCSLTLGTSQNEKDGACLAINMINKNGINEKRNGHVNIQEFSDINLSPLRINGIYSYSYTNSEGVKGEYKIVHAGDKFFRCNADFSGATEITKDTKITILDEKSQALMLGNDLFIAGGAELLLYDGEIIKSAYKSELAYVPMTAYGITDQANGGLITKGEGENLFTRKRRISLRGSNHYRENNKPNLFILDSNIEYGTKFVLEVKIRTRTSEEEISENTTSYVGIDKESGEEVSKIVKIRFVKSSINGNNAFFVSEPIRDEDGNIVNLKFNDKTYTYDALPFGVSVRNKNELRLSFEAVTPLAREDNITVEYEAESEPQMIKHTKLLSLSNCENGKELLLVNFGDNKIYFTDKQNGIFHMPRDNEISLGSDGEPISAIVRLSDNLIGVFKKNSFYRVRFTSSNDKGYEIFLSSDSVGAYSQSSSGVVNYDCLVFNREGVFGVNDYKSTANIFDALRSRSFKINSFLKEHSQSERENAVALVCDKRYYLFIGDKAYIADTRYKVKGTGADTFGYEWWIWTGLNARIAYTDGESIYLGTENGQIRMITSGHCDTEIRNYKSSEMSLICTQNDDYTEFTLSDSPEIKEGARAFLENHERLLAKGISANDKVLMLSDYLCASDGTPKAHIDTSLSIYKDGSLVSNTKVVDMDISKGEITTRQSLSKGVKYDVYVREEAGREYDIVQENNAYFLLEKGGRVKISQPENANLTLYERENVESLYLTSPLSFDLPTKRKTLKSLCLKIPKWAGGKIDVEIRTNETVKKREITLGKALDFNSFDFNNVSFSGELDMLVPVLCRLRSFDYLTLKISSHDDAPFGIDTVFFEYTIQE